MRAGFEPAETHRIPSETDAFGHNGTQIGTHKLDMYSHSESRSVTEELPADLQEVIDAWPTLSVEL